MAIEQSLKSVAMMLRDDSISETIVYNFFIFYYCISLKFMFQIFRLQSYDKNLSCANVFKEKVAFSVKTFIK